MAHETYIKHGENSDTAVLFIHGFLGSTEHFAPFISGLAPEISVYNLLLAGHGKGVREFAKASMAQWENQVKTVAEELCGKYERIYIVGHSMGTFFAMQSAIRHGDRVKGIMLLQSPLKIGVKPAAVINTVKSFFDSESETAVAYRKAHSVRLNMRLWQYIGWIPRYIELFKASEQSRKTIRRVECPCFILQSKRDELVSVKSVKYIPEKENIKLTMLEESTHFIYSADDMRTMLDVFGNMVKKC